MIADSRVHLPDPVKITVRLLGRVRREAKCAATGVDADRIHDLRVSIRRSRQCLAVFARSLPRRVVRKARKKLGKILDKAGPPRDIDIAIELVKAAGVHPVQTPTRALRKERTRSTGWESRLPEERMQFSITAQHSDLIDGSFLTLYNQPNPHVSVSVGDPQ